MSLHALSRITVGVPDVAAAKAFYLDFGLQHLASTVDRGPTDEVRLSTTDGGDQLALVPAPRRRLNSMDLSVDDLDDIDRIASNLNRLGVVFTQDNHHLSVTDPGTDVRVRVAVRPRLTQPSCTPPSYNAPGCVVRQGVRAVGVLRESVVRPRKLGHVVVGSTDLPVSERVFIDGLGFKVSDRVPGVAAFLRCSTDHHNLLVQSAPFPLLHHSSWQVDDVDEVGRGATAMLAKDPSRHVWGLGRHHIGSNFFWYLKDPAGNFSEYYSDLDCIVDDQLWRPQDFDDARALYSWGPPPPPSFLVPDDLAELMTGSHTMGDTR
jgi:catechol 2,3-dioxygenase-like lactoylglutathione lyase family enzyme